MMNKKLRPIMFAGTGSDVGKSVIAAAFCRIFRQDGYHPAPFKAQNMALNSYATPEGLEIGRAQAVQAEAAGIPCHSDMNPLLLKPSSDHTSQVVLHGKPIGNRDAYDFWRRSSAAPIVAHASQRENDDDVVAHASQRENDVATPTLGSVGYYPPRFVDMNQHISIKGSILPHWQQCDSTMFVTFRLADSLPQTKLQELIAFKAEWLNRHPLPWDEQTNYAYEREVLKKTERWLDEGYGSCVLSRPDIRQIVTDTLMHNDGKLYVLHHFVIMPNHVHLLATPISEQDMTKSIGAVKQYSAKAINKALGTHGDVWQRRSFDHLVRNAKHYDRFVNYIRNNPQNLPPGTFTLYSAADVVAHADVVSHAEVVAHASQRGSNDDVVTHASERENDEAVPTLGSVGYYDFRAEVCAAFDRLALKYNPIVMEGAGSISELNLKDTDLVNLPMARHASAAVILVADIDRGGVFASVYGSIALQTPEDRALIKGIIINKFRGDLRLFDEGRKMLEDICGVPVLGVVPYYKDIHIDEEDSVALEQKRRQLADGKVNVAVVLLRHISNFTDFDTLERDPRVNLFYTNNVQDLQRADIIILPGTKSTLDDLLELRRNGCAQAILSAHRNGKTIVGICGGYQMMGLSVDDPDGIEGPVASLPGLGILPIRTVITPEKTTRQVTFQFEGHECHGYEIHQGISVEAHADVVAHASQRGSSNDVVAHTSQRGNTEQPVTLGSVTYYDHCIGTYIHGFLDNPPVIEHLLKGHSAAPAQSLADFKEEQYDKLAAHVRQYVDVGRIYQILGSDKSQIVNQ